MRRALMAAVVALLPFAAAGQNPPKLDSLATSKASGAVGKGLEGVSWDQKLGHKVPLDLTFYDEQGRSVQLGDFAKDRPILLALVYYRCPMLCTLVLNGVVRGLRPLDLQPGKDFEIVAVSFDPNDRPQDAVEKAKTYIADYGRGSAGWHFLTTADEKTIHQLTDAVGFHYRWDADLGQFAHPSGITILTPEGKVSRYLWGIEYAPKDLKLGLIDSSDGKVGTFVDQAILYCYHYDPKSGTYGGLTMNLIRAGGVLTLLLLGSFVVLTGRRKKKEEGA